MYSIYQQVQEQNNVNAAQCAMDLKSWRWQRLQTWSVNGELSLLDHNDQVAAMVSELHWISY
jgi:hypothetical protein